MEEDVVTTPETDDVQTQEFQAEEAPNEVDEVAPQEDATDQPETDEPEPAEDNAAIEGEEVDEDVNLFAKPLPQTRVPEVDINQFMDADGNLDVRSYNQAVNQRMEQIAQSQSSLLETKMSLQSSYKDQWNKATEYWPELKGNTKLRAMVNAVHQESIEGDKYVSPLAAAREVRAMFGQQKQQGIQAAKVSRTTQSAAHLERSAAPANATGNRESQLKDQIKNARSVKEHSEAMNGYLSELIKSGRL
jgi:hypothetical protein